MGVSKLWKKNKQSCSHTGEDLQVEREESCVVPAARQTSCTLAAFNNPKLSDFVVHGPTGKCYYCSKFLLSSGSTKFAELFNEAAKSEDGQGLHIPTGDADAIESLLRYLHLGLCDLKNETFLAIMSIASEYGVEKLEAECVAFERNRLEINLGNCFVILLKAIEHTRKELVIQCETYIAKHIEFVTLRPEFLNLPYAILKGILSSAALMFDDHRLDFSCMGHLITGICRWIDHNEDNAKVALSILGGIPFGICTQREIALLLSCKAARQNPDISSFIVEEISVSCIGLSVQSPGFLLKSTASESPDALIPRGSCWKKWVAPSTTWFYVLAKGGKGLDHLRNPSKNTNVSQSKTLIEGGTGVVIGGALFLNEGDMLKLLSGKTVNGGGSACIVVLPKRPGFRPVLFAVAAGGGGAGSAKPGKSGELDVGFQLDDLLKSPPHETLQSDAASEFSGSHCGQRTATSSDVSTFSGSCTCCDGGKGGAKKMTASKSGGGGAGFYGGMGNMVMGGNGGRSFVSASAANVVVYNGCSSISGVSIFSGRDVPRGYLPH